MAMQWFLWAPGERVETMMLGQALHRSMVTLTGKRPKPTPQGAGLGPGLCEVIVPTLQHPSLSIKWHPWDSFFFPTKCKLQAQSGPVYHRCNPVATSPDVAGIQQAWLMLVEWGDWVISAVSLIRVLVAPSCQQCSLD